MMRNDGYGDAAATHYQVLNVSASSTLDEIRACYRAALLAVHPDKQGSKEDSSSRYLRVQEAWSVLRDAESRAEYDASVKSSGGVGAAVVVGEEVVLEDMEECESESGGDLEYWYPCRCSDFFVVGARELQSAGMRFGEDAASVGVGSGVDALGGDGGVDWNRQRQSIVLPCGSCSLHLRVYFWVPCT
ncbi:hypothetical protein KC19_8G162000 [Ceratodon purpureus]|uniref:Diphthamide biosynthesis protein 4 n=1 Tax=Ceratodon purpureus TaxID=3225 RepID=A0A8T0H2R8_CERPU|nr:hypothetical protein KC19_8G162000 [Ceratodon purpureus]